MKKYSIFLILFLISCAPTLQSLSDSEREKITTRIFSNTYEDVFNACLERLEKRGHTISNIDSKVGIITTDWKQSENTASKILVGNIRAKSTVRVKKLSDNESKVYLTLQAEKQGAFGSWESMPITSDMKANYDEFFNGVNDILNSY